MGRCVIVLGMHRSGTSATAGVLHHLGVNMGPVLIGATEANRKGHYEDQELALLNEDALGSWHTPVPRVARHRTRYQQLFAERARRSELWGMKDPRMCLTFDHVADWLRSTPGVDDVRCVAVNRPFNEAVSSLVKRDGWARDRAVQIQSIYQYRMVETIEHFSGELLGVDFPDLIDDPASVVAEVAHFVYAGLDSQAGDARISEAAAFIDPSLRHHAGDTGADDDDGDTQSEEPAA